MGADVPRAIVVTTVVATLVAVSAFGAVFVLRTQRDDAASAAGPPAPTTTDAAATCGNRPCEVLTSLPVGRTTVELLADADGGNGRLRILESSPTVLETALAPMDVTLTQRSLSCQSGPRSGCVVRGGHNGGVVGEVFVNRGGHWRSVERPYFSTAGYLDLVHVAGDYSPEILVAQHDCAQGRSCSGPVVVEVFGLDGSSVGCTRPYDTLSQLPGWPEVDVDHGDLVDC